jgi:hypothetical protein
MGRNERNYQQTVDGRGSDCEWSTILEILSELNELHDRLRRIDEAGEGGTEISARYVQSSAQIVDD